MAAVALLLGGIWLGGHPNGLLSPLRGTLFEHRRSETVTEQALNILTTRYFRPLKRSSLVDLGLAGMVAGLDDPYSRYIEPSAHQGDMHASAAQMVGIGIDTTSEPRGLRVVDVRKNSPAARAGLRRGDLVVKVGQTSLAHRADGLGEDLIRGPAGTTVTLTVLRDGAESVIPVARRKSAMPVVSSRMLAYQGVRIGYLRLTRFAEGSGEKLRTAAQTVLHARAQALILDLRENGGGLIRDAITVASAFLAHGTIMSAVERNQPRRVYAADGNAVAAHVPLVVLVDHGTASAAEIVTAALQDHGRAKVVGTPTYGKGVFQLTLPLINRGALDITIGEFFTPDGRSLDRGASHRAGIVPNVYAPAGLREPADTALTVAERTVTAAVKGTHR